MISLRKFLTFVSILLMPLILSSCTTVLNVYSPEDGDVFYSDSSPYYIDLNLTVKTLILPIENCTDGYFNVYVNEVLVATQSYGGGDYHCSYDFEIPIPIEFGDNEIVVITDNDQIPPEVINVKLVKKEPEPGE